MVLMIFLGISFLVGFIIAYCIAIYDLYEDYKKYNKYFTCLPEQSSYVFYCEDIINKSFLSWRHESMVDIKYIPLSFKEIMNFQSLNPDKWNISNGKDVFRHWSERYTNLYWLYNNEYIVYYKTYRDYKKGLKYKEQLEKEAENAEQRKAQALANEQLAVFLENIQEDINIVKQKTQEDIKKAAEITLTIADRLTAEQLVDNINSYFNTYGTKILLHDFAECLAIAYNCSYFDVAAIVKELGGTICE